MYVFQAFTNLFLIQSYIPFGHFSFNGVSWSLSDEFFFYFLFPFILLFFIKGIKNNNVKLLIIGVLWIIIIFTFLSLPNNNDIVYWLSYIFPGTRIVEFISGVIIGLIYLENKDLMSKIKGYIFTLFEIILISVLVLVVYISPSFNQYLRYGMIYLPFWGSIIYVFAFNKGIISKFLSKKLFIYLGDISFSFYMIHNLVLSYILFLWKPNIPVFITIIICFILSIVLSSLMYHYYEESMRKKVKRYLNKLRDQKGFGKVLIIKDTNYTLEK